MPEILVENEPWLGLSVLANTEWPLGSPGYYVLARADEWHSDSQFVTVWRGPERKDEMVSRVRLQEMECRTVLVDERGFYTCPPIIDDLKDAVEKASEDILNYLANERAAESWSYVEREDAAEKYETHEVYAIATAGDVVAVNGELRNRQSKPPRNYVKTEDGGRHPSGHENEVDKDTVAEHIAIRLTDQLKREISQDDVRELLDKIYRNRGNYMIWVSDTIDTEVYISRKALRKWERGAEEREEREKRRRQAEQLRVAEENRRLRAEQEERERQERLKQEAEDREKVRRGGWPSPKDWSPRGRLPGDR